MVAMLNSETSICTLVPSSGMELSKFLMYIFIEPFCVCVVNTTDNKEVGPIYDNVATAQWLSVILLSLYTINPFTIVSEIRIKMILLFNEVK